MIRSNPCKLCSSTWHTAAFCPQNRKPIKVVIRQPLKRYKRPRQQSDKEKEYQVWKETVARPFVIERDGNECWCCKRPAYEGEKLDMEHTLGKGSHPKLKRVLSNFRLYCRFPCHDNKTNNRPCLHGMLV